MEGRASFADRPADSRQKVGTFAGVIHRKSSPLPAFPQICKETSAVLMKMQKGPASDIKYPGPPLDEVGPGPEVHQQIVQRVQCACASVFHRPFRNRSAASIRARPSQ